MEFKEHMETLKQSEEYKHHDWLFEMLGEQEDFLNEKYRQGFKIEISKTPCNIIYAHTDTLLEMEYEVTLIHPVKKDELVGVDVYVASITTDLSLLIRDLTVIRRKRDEHKDKADEFAVKIYSNMVRLLQNKIRKYRRRNAC